ncbi:MAG: hypothetical protein U0939_23555 [Pirellulales bacterium]
MSQPQRMRSRARVRFVASVAALSFIWLVVLPSIGRLTAVREHVARLEAARIDPSAMYYTELEMMNDVRDSVHDFHRRHPSGLWSGRMSDEPPIPREPGP